MPIVKPTNVIDIGIYNKFLTPQHYETERIYNMDIIDYLVIRKIGKDKPPFHLFIDYNTKRNSDVCCHLLILYKLTKCKDKLIRKYIDWYLSMYDQRMNPIFNLIKGKVYDYLLELMKKYERSRLTLDYNLLMIDVYDIARYTTYQPFDDDKIYVKSNKFTFNIGDQIIEREDLLKQKITQFTNGIFNKFNWDNVIYSGSTVGALMNPKCRPEDINIQSDIDLFVYGDSSDERMHKINYIYKYFKDMFEDDLFVSYAGFAITL